MVLPGQSLIRDPNAVPPDPSQYYGVPTSIQSTDENDIVRAEVDTTADGRIELSTRDAAGDPTGLTILIGNDGSIVVQQGSSELGFNADGDGYIAVGDASITIPAAGTSVDIFTPTGELHVTPDGIALNIQGFGDVLLADDAGAVIINGSGVVSIGGLPTSDPGGGGIWVNPANAGALTIGDGS